MISTTHTGSLPRPDDLVALMWRKMDGVEYDAGELARQVRDAVRALVDRQRATGITIVNDGEAGRPAFHLYVAERMTGFAPTDDASLEVDDLADFPSLLDNLRSSATEGLGHVSQLKCIGPVNYVGASDLAADLALLRDAVGDSGDAFVSAVTPGTLAMNMPNEHYPSYEAFMQALATELRVEYEAIWRAGFILQLDAPDLAMAAHARYAGTNPPPFREHFHMALDAIDSATAAIPPDRMRLHVCWGNYAGPHDKDLPLSAILSDVLRARPAGLSFEAANPRHAHEWEIFAQTSIPGDRVLIPGVIDTTSHHVEHPRLVAQRLERFARMVGRERLIAGTDCGFSTAVGQCNVHPEIAWRKLAALVAGAELV